MAEGTAMERLRDSAGRFLTKAAETANTMLSPAPQRAQETPTGSHASRGRTPPPQTPRPHRRGTSLETVFESAQTVRSSSAEPTPRSRRQTPNTTDSAAASAAAVNTTSVAASAAPPPGRLPDPWSILPASKPTADPWSRHSTGAWGSGHTPPRPTPSGPAPPPAAPTPTAYAGPSETFLHNLIRQQSDQINALTELARSSVEGRNEARRHHTPPAHRPNTEPSFKPRIANQKIEDTPQPPTPDTNPLTAIRQLRKYRADLTTFYTEIYGDDNTSADTQHAFDLVDDLFQHWNRTKAHLRSHLEDSIKHLPTTWDEYTPIEIFDDDTHLHEKWCDFQLQPLFAHLLGTLSHSTHKAAEKRFDFLQRPHNIDNWQLWLWTQFWITERFSCTEQKAINRIRSQLTHPSFHLASLANDLHQWEADFDLYTQFGPDPHCLRTATEHVAKSIQRQLRTANPYCRHAAKIDDILEDSRFGTYDISEHDTRLVLREIVCRARAAPRPSEPAPGKPDTGDRPSPIPNGHCRDFINRECRRGANCPFKHDTKLREERRKARSERSARPPNTEQPRITNPDQPRAARRTDTQRVPPPCGYVLRDRECPRQKTKGGCHQDHDEKHRGKAAEYRCWLHSQGKCERGDNCAFKHESNPTAKLTINGEGQERRDTPPADPSPPPTAPTDATRNTANDAGTTNTTLRTDAGQSVLDLLDPQDTLKTFASHIPAHAFTIDGKTPRISESAFQDKPEARRGNTTRNAHTTWSKPSRRDYYIDSGANIAVYDPDDPRVIEKSNRLLTLDVTDAKVEYPLGRAQDAFGTVFCLLIPGSEPITPGERIQTFLRWSWYANIFSLENVKTGQEAPTYVASGIPRLNGDYQMPPSDFPPSAHQRKHPKPPPTHHTARVSHITFGRHAGRTYDDIYHTDPSYCTWILNQDTSTASRELLQFRRWLIHDAPPPRLQGGAHSGRTVDTIFHSDPNFCRWLLQHNHTNHSFTLAQRWISRQPAQHLFRPPQCGCGHTANANVLDNTAHPAHHRTFYTCGSAGHNPTCHFFQWQGETPHSCQLCGDHHHHFRACPHFHQTTHPPNHTPYNITNPNNWPHSPIHDEHSRAEHALRLCLHVIPNDDAQTHPFIDASHPQAAEAAIFIVRSTRHLCTSTAQTARTIGCTSYGAQHALNGNIQPRALEALCNAINGLIIQGNDSDGSFQSFPDDTDLPGQPTGRLTLLDTVEGETHHNTNDYEHHHHPGGQYAPGGRILRSLVFTCLATLATGTKREHGIGVNA
ncbi:MAG: hypothetical protein CMJ89_20855, partial [Planctomycetes bacterium]|nr:hypothetical protein [Planctomycetota bacterium]